MLLRAPENPARHVEASRAVMAEVRVEPPLLEDHRGARLAVLGMHLQGRGLGLLKNLHIPEALARLDIHGEHAQGNAPVRGVRVQQRRVRKENPPGGDDGRGPGAAGKLRAPDDIVLRTPLERQAPGRGVALGGGTTELRPAGFGARGACRQAGGEEGEGKRLGHGVGSGNQPNRISEARLGQARGWAQRAGRGGMV